MTIHKPKLKKNHTRSLITSGIMAALIFAFTALVHIPVSSQGAYVNIGDSVIYASALLLGAPWAAAAAGIGSMFADVLLGGGIYIPATLVIKGLMGFVCALLMHSRNRIGHSEQALAETPLQTGRIAKVKQFFQKNSAFIQYLLVCILGGAIMVAGYGVYEWAIWGLGYVTTTILPNMIQWAAGVVGAIALYYPVKMIRETLR